MLRSVFLLVLLSSAGASSSRSLLQSPSAEVATRPRGGRCVVINEVVHKPENKGEVEGVDFIEFYNSCKDEVDLKGWSLTDEDDTSFVMGQDGCSHTVAPSDFLVLFRDNPCSFEFGYTGVDKASLIDPDGDVVQVVEWGMDDANLGRSWSAIPDGSEDFQDGLPTPGLANEPFE